MFFFFFLLCLANLTIYREIVALKAQQKLSFLHVAMLLVSREDLQSVRGHIVSSKAELTKAKHTHTHTHTHTARRHAGRAMSDTDLLILYGLRKDHSPL